MPSLPAVTIRQAAGQQQRQHGQPLQLDVRGPSRFFSLQASSAGGSVAVEVIQEGSLRLATGGGSISVPKVMLILALPAHACTIEAAELCCGTSSCRACSPRVGPPLRQVKAFDAHLDSGGGAIAGSVTGVDVRLRSAGGLVSLKSLVGKQAEVDSGGGPVSLGACYADQLHVQSGEGGRQC